ncbi:MAG TPA: MmcQ/YjbR family DNA-binding protein [Bryobacteraceae bacterium]|jgi:hypothetical protein|nr:MmcQ/YjbR family DNA-binding protein [Bryobacteraceae bacterium]
MAKAKTTKNLGEEQIQRVRRICMAMPEVTEKLSHGEPTWFVRKRVFAGFSNNHHNDGHVAVCIPAAPGVQQQLIKASPKTYYRPPYVGPSGWVGIEMGQIDDEDLAVHLHEARDLILAKYRK